MLMLLLRKDLTLLFRSLRLVLAVGFFALLLVIISSFAFRRPGLGAPELTLLLPGVYWTTFLFVTVVTLHESFAGEEENRALLGLILCGVPAELVFFAKLLANWLFLAILQIAIMAFSLLFFAVGIGSAALPILALGLLVSLGVLGLGTMLAAISSSVRGRELLLPVILFPLSLPVLLGAVTASGDLLAGSPFWHLGFPLVLITVFDVVVLTLAFVLFEPLVLE